MADRPWCKENMVASVRGFRSAFGYEENGYEETIYDCTYKYVFFSLLVDFSNFYGKENFEVNSFSTFYLML